MFLFLLLQEIMTKGYDENIQSFVMHYGCDELDAALLILPLVFFISPTDPRMLSTIKAIDRSPAKVCSPIGDPQGRLWRRVC
jgi:GH15 family glucan-1,4-alpha-glucosidase